MTPEELRAMATERRAKLGDKESRLTRALDDAAADIEKLSAALKSIADMKMPWQKMPDVARRALEQKVGEE